MAFKIAVIFATLAYVSAGAIETGIHHASQVPAAVSYQYRSQVIKPSVPRYATTGHPHVQPVLPQPVVQAVPAPIVKTFAVPATVKAVTTYDNGYGYSGYGHEYVPGLAYGNGYGYAGVSPAVNYGHYAAEPVLATGAYGYTPVGHVGYNKYGQHAY